MSDLSTCMCSTVRDDLAASLSLGRGFIFRSPDQLKDESCGVWIDQTRAFAFWAKILRVRARAPLCTSNATDAYAGRNSAWPALNVCYTCVRGSPSPRIEKRARIMTAFTRATLWTSHWCCSHRHASGFAAHAWNWRHCPECLTMNLYTWNTQLVFITGTAMVRVNSVIRLCQSSVPATMTCTGRWWREPILWHSDSGPATWWHSRQLLVRPLGVPCEQSKVWT
jgi:hypothetical protein